MTSFEILAVLRRWWWLIVALSVVTTLVLSLRLTPTYTSRVTLQITPPPSEQVLFFEQNPPYSNLRDDLVVARNNFMETARSSGVRDQTIEALQLTEENRGYVVDATEVRDSDFVVLSVDAPTAASARAIADAHATLSIQQTARLRTLPALATKQLLTTQVATALAALQAAQGEATGASTGGTAPAVSAGTADPSPQSPLSQARANYTFWQKELSEAELKSDTSYAASFMQMVTPAELPSQPSTQKVRAQLVMGALGSLLLSFLLATGLDALGRRVTSSRSMARANAKSSGVARL